MLKDKIEKNKLKKNKKTTTKKDNDIFNRSKSSQP